MMTEKEWEEIHMIDAFMENRHSGYRYKEWRVLMEVVEKIESIYDKHDGFYGVYINSNSCTIQGTNMWRYQQNPEYGTVYMINIVQETKLQSTYEAVVSFIQWHNNKS